ncbi:MAG: FRG domain-containing protein [Planctomycetota bacterium]
MFQEENLNTWDEFERKIRDLEEETSRLKDDPHAIYATTEVLYRGEGKAEWPQPLSTTLDRNHKRIMTVGQYFDYIIKNSTSSSNISTPELEILKRKISKLNIDNIYQFPTTDADTMEIISLMSELRHNGFPSPLVDWTSDYLVGAFFAFEKEHNNSRRVAIFAFRNRTGYQANCKKGTNSTAINIGHFIVNPSSRHTRQKSQYSLCVKQGRGVCFKDAEFVNILEDINRPGFILLKNGEARDRPVHNVLYKYTLPVSQRKSILDTLYGKGINRISLGLS